MEEKIIKIIENPFMKFYNKMSEILDFIRYDKKEKNNDDESEFILDKLSYISKYNPGLLTNSCEKFKNFDYLTNIFFMRNLTFTIIGYYGLVSIFCLYRGNLKTFHANLFYVNHCFKRTFYVPIITYFLAHKYYFSRDFYYKLFENELKNVSSYNENIFLEKKKTYEKLIKMKNEILETKTINKNEKKEEYSQKIFPKTEDKKNEKKSKNIHGNKMDYSNEKEENNVNCQEFEKYFILKYISEMERKNIF